MEINNKSEEKSRVDTDGSSRAEERGQAAEPGQIDRGRFALAMCPVSCILIVLFRYFRRLVSGW